MTSHRQMLSTLSPTRQLALLAMWLCIAALLALLVNELLFALTRYPEFRALFPAAVGWRFACHLLVAKLALVSLIGVAFLRQWALWLCLITGILMVSLDLLTQAPVPHMLGVIVSAAVLLALGIVNRDCFEP